MSWSVALSLHNILTHVRELMCGARPSCCTPEVLAPELNGVEQGKAGAFNFLSVAGPSRRKPEVIGDTRLLRLPMEELTESNRTIRLLSRIQVSVHLDL